MIEDKISGILKEAINELIAKEIELATERIKQKLKDELGRIGIRLSNHFHIQQNEHEITITYKEEK